MALDRSVQYPGRFFSPTPEQPQGGFKNRTTDTSFDGSYLERDWLDDWSGFFSSILDANGDSPNGLVDEVGASQYFKNMLKLREVDPLNSDWNGYLDPQHTVPIEFEDTNVGTRQFSADVELAPNIFSSADLNDIEFSLTGWSFSEGIYKLYTFTSQQLALIDTDDVPIYIKDESGNDHFVNGSTNGVNVTKPDSTTLKVEITADLITELGISRVWYFFVTDRVGYVPDVGPDDLIFKLFSSLGFDLSENGYATMPNGLIFQWMTNVYISGTTNQVATLPIPFTTAIYNWNGCSDDVLGGSCEVFTRRGESLSSVTYFISDGSGLPIASNATVYIFAIGK